MPCPAIDKFSATLPAESWKHFYDVETFSCMPKMLKQYIVLCRKCINESWNAARLLVLWHFDLKCIGRIWRMENLRIVVQFSSLNMILKDIHRHFAGITVVSDLVVHLLQFNAATAWCADFCHQVVVAQHAQDMGCSLHQPSPLHQYCNDITIGFCNDIL